MNSKLNGKLEAQGRACLRSKDTKDVIAVYPHKVEGTDQEIEEKVRYWFYQQSCEAEREMEDYYVDTLSPMEMKNAQEKFVD